MPSLSFDIASQLTSMQDYIDLITGSSTQAEFISSVMSMFGLGAPYADLLCPYEANGTPKAVDLLQMFGIDLGSYTSMITDKIPSIVDNLKTYHDYNYTDYIKLLETITFDDFLT